MFELFRHSYRRVFVMAPLVLTGFLWASPHAWAQG